MAGDTTEQQVWEAMRESDVFGVTASELILALEHAGLRFCTAAERKVLEACRAVPMSALGMFAASPGPAWEPLRLAIRALLWAESELPHGIPDGENDKGWPDGTPESVTKGERNV